MWQVSDDYSQETNNRIICFFKSLKQSVFTVFTWKTGLQSAQKHLQFHDNLATASADKAHLI